MRLGRVAVAGSLLLGIAGAARAGDERVPLALADGTVIMAQVRTPPGCRPGTRLPAVLVFGGFEEAGRVLDLVRPTAPVILASFDYPYAGSRVFRFPETLLDAGKLRKSVRDTQAGIELLVSHLRGRRDVDPRRMAIVGASFGAPFAVAAAAEQEALGALIVVHGFGDVRGAIRYRLQDLWSERLGFLSGAAAGAASFAITGILDPPAPERDARRLRASQFALMVEAIDDWFIAADSRKAFWEAIASSPARSERIRMPGDHLQPGSEDLIDEILGRALHWLRRSAWIGAASPC